MPLSFLDDDQTLRDMLTSRRVLKGVAGRKNQEMSHDVAPQGSFYGEGILGDLQRDMIDPYGHKGIRTPQPELRQRQYGIQDPRFRGGYDAEASFSPLGALATQAAKAAGVDLPGMKARVGDFLAPVAAIESAVTAGQNLREGDVAGGIGHTAMAGVDAAATSLGTGAMARGAGFAPSRGIFSDLAAGGLPSDVTATSAMIGPSALHWDKTSEALYDTAKANTNLSERKLFDATGTYTTPYGQKRQVVADDVAIAPLAAPNEGELLRQAKDANTLSEYNSLRGDQMDLPWPEFRDKYQSRWKEADEAKARDFEFYKKFSSEQKGKIGESITGSAALRNFPDIANEELIRARNSIDGFNGSYSPGNMVVTQDRSDIAGHELEHAIQGRIGSPRGASVKEMQDYQYDLDTRIRGLKDGMDESEVARVHALDRGDLASAAESARAYEFKKQLHDELTADRQISPFDRYQSSRGEREARYAQLGLSGDDMRMLSPEDYMQAEKNRTGLDDLMIGQNERLTAGSGDIMQGAARGPDEVPASVMTRRGNNPEKIAKAEANVANYRQAYPPSAGWKPFEVKYSSKDGKLDWNPTADSGFDYHIDPATGKEYTGAARSEQVGRMSDGMVSDYENVLKAAQGGDQQAIETLDALQWYNKVREKNRDFFGASGQVFGELQGATSKNTGLPENMRMADELFTRFIKGDFQPAIDALSRHIADGGTVKNFDAKPYIKKLGNNKLFGMHTNDITNVMVDNFRRQLVDKPPKIRNYAGNWTGSSKDPTVDMWAGRTAQRVAGRDRVIPAWSAVTGKWKPDTGSIVAGKRLNEQGIDVPMHATGAYGVGADAMKDAVSKLKAKYPKEFATVTPDDFQAFEWINEKNIWDQGGWGAPGVEVNAIDILGKQPRNLYRASISPTNTGTPSNQIQRNMMQGLERGVGGPGVSSVTRPTQGRYAGDPEMAIAHETYAPSGWNPSRLVSNVAEEASIRNQIDAMLSRRTDAGDPNARPGFEAYYNQDEAGTVRPRIEQAMQRHGIDAATDLQGPARGMPIEGPMPNPINESVGVQSMFSPEISMRYGEELAPGISVRDIINNPEMINLVSAVERKKFKRLVEEIQQMEGVHFAKQYEYDTLHFGEGMHGGPETYRDVLGNPEVGPPNPASVFGARGIADRLRYGPLRR